MMKLWNCVLALGVSVLLFSPAMAEDAKPKKPKAGAARKEQPAVQLPKEIELTDEQKPKIAEVEKEFAPKMKELRQKLDKVLTEDQKKARAEGSTHEWQKGERVATSRQGRDEGH